MNASLASQPETKQLAQSEPQQSEPQQSEPNNSPNPKPAGSKKQKSSSAPKPKAPVLDLTMERLMVADTSLSEDERQLAKNMIAMSEKVHAVKLTQHAKALKAWQAQNMEVLRPKYENTVKLYLACKYKVAYNESMLRTYTQKLSGDFGLIFRESDIDEEALEVYTKGEQERVAKKRARDLGRKKDTSNKKAKADGASGNDSDKSDD
jgi:hypothetical protein